MSWAQTHFVPGTSPGFLLILHNGSPACPRDKPSLSLGRSQGRRVAEKVYVFKVYVPFSLAMVFLQDFLQFDPRKNPSRLLQDRESPNPQKCRGECWEDCRDCWGDCCEQCWEVGFFGKSRETALLPAVPPPVLFFSPGSLPSTLPGTFGDLGFLGPVAGGWDSNPCEGKLRRLRFAILGRSALDVHCPCPPTSIAVKLPSLIPARLDFGVSRIPLP